VDNQVLDIADPSKSNSGKALGFAGGLLLFALALAILVPGTVGVSLVDRDEGWYAQVCREMLESGDWLVPRYLGEVWLAKPPLLYWLVTPCFYFLGVGDWQARLVPVLCSAISVLLVGMLGSRMFGRRVGILAGVFFITCGLPAIVGKMLLTDAPMLTCTLAAVFLHWRMASDRVTHLRAGGYWLAIGLGILAKGPAVLFFAGAFGLALLFCRGMRGWFIDWRWWVWLPLGLLVASPWYVYMFHHAGDTLAEQFLWYEVFSRIASEPHGHGGPPGAHALLSLFGLLPWTIFVPGVLIESFRRRKDDASLRLLLIWLAVPWIILELIHSKLPHYIVPCYVALALLLGRLLDERLHDSRLWPALDGRERRAFNLWVGIMIVLASLGMLPAIGSRQPVAIITAGVLGAGFALAGWIMRRRPLKSAWVCAVAVTVLFHMSVGFLLLPAFEPLRLSRNVADAINETAWPGDRIYICGYSEPTMHFYLENRAQEIYGGDLEGILASADSEGAVLLAVTQRELDRLSADFGKLIAPKLKQHAIEGVNYAKEGRRTTVWVSRHTPSGRESRTVDSRE